jgi:hypothetical protein
MGWPAQPPLHLGMVMGKGLGMSMSTWQLAPGAEG